MNSLYKFDFQAIVGVILSYLEYIRLMIVMACLGLLSGIIYFTYCIPTFSTQSEFDFNFFQQTVNDSESQSHASNIRQVIQDITSPTHLLETAKGVGMLPHDATIESLKRTGIKVNGQFMGRSTFVVQVDSPNPEVARSFAQQVVKAYLKNQQGRWEQYRKVALDRYSEEVRSIEEKAFDDLKQLSKFDRDGGVKESEVEHLRINALPLTLLKAKTALASLELLQKQLKDKSLIPKGASEIDVVIHQLSLYEKTEFLSPAPQIDAVVRTELGLSSPQDSTGSRLALNLNLGDSKVSSSWKSLLNRRSQIQTNLRKALEIYLPQHQSVLKLELELQEVDESLKKELANRKTEFEFNMVHLQREIELLETQFQNYYKVNEDAKIMGSQRSRIANRQLIWESAATALAQKVATMGYNENIDWVEISFKGYLSRRDVDPVSPGKMKLAIFATWVAIGAALGSATLLKIANTTISTIGQLEGITSIPAIGLIPLVDKGLLDLAHSQSENLSPEVTQIHETYRTIRSHLLLQPNPSDKNQVILITSARPNEGKTSQALNIAWALASAGKKTLLIDGDLRRGRLNHVFHSESLQGFSSVLKKVVPWQDVVIASHTPDLHYICRGPHFSGAPDEFSKDFYVQVIEEMREEFDHIVIDSPPLLGLNESLAMQRAVDGVVLVVKAESTTRHDLNEVMRLLEISKIHVYGSILNGLNTKKLSNYYYYSYTPSYAYYAET